MPGPTLDVHGAAVSDGWLARTGPPKEHTSSARHAAAICFLIRPIARSTRCARSA